jgi:ligand-binding sensor domain-containing protein
MHTLRGLTTSDRSVKASIFSLALLLVLGVAARSDAFDVDNVLTGYTVSSWTHADDLRLSSVSAIVQDPDGYLWVGTDSGLIRFDGVRFVPWQHLSDSPLPQSEVSALAISRDGSVLVGFGDAGGIWRIRNGHAQPITGSHRSPVSVTAIVEDGRGTLWAIGDRALHRLNDGRWEKVPVRVDFVDQPVNALHIDAEGRLLVGTVAGLFESLDAALRFRRMSNRWVWDVNEDPAGTLWITDIEAGFGKLHEQIHRQANRASGYRLLHDREGDLWVGTLGAGLWHVQNGNAARPTIEKLTLHSGLSSDSVQSLLQDREGNIWVGTAGGLHRLTRRKLHPVVDIGSVGAVEANNSANVWIGTSNGLIRYNVGTLPMRSQRVGPSDLFIRNLRFDRQGILWIAARDGSLYQLIRGNPTRRVKLPREYVLTPTTSMAADSRRGVWLCDGNRAVHWDGVRLTPFRIPREPGIKVTSVMGDTSGRLWFALEGGRLGLRDSHETLRIFGKDEGYRPDLHANIFDIFEDQDHDVWISSSEALTRFSKGRFTTVTPAAGLPRNQLGAVVDDNEGGLWLNVEVGLVRLMRDEFERAASNPAHRLQYEIYDTSDGLAGVPILNVGAARARDGRLWFIRGGGLTVINASDIGNGPQRAPWRVRIESAIADEKQFVPGLPLTLPARTKNLQISYTALTLTAPDKIPFRYRLEGFDTDWIDAGTRRQAYYTNLPPGSYRFRVEAKGGALNPNQSAAAWEFAVAPMFYQRGWFFLTSLAVLGLAVGGAWSVRLRLVRRQFAAVLEERTRLSREIHDTLLQSLVGVALQFDAMSRDVGPLPFAVKERFVRTRREVNAYIREARQSIWDLRSPILETHDLATAFRQFGKRATAGTSTRFVSTVIGRRRRYSAKVENQLLRIGQEAITNAVRHARAERINLELRDNERSVTLRVWDDGGGFDLEYSTPEADGHYGLTSMRERTEQLGGSFKITSTHGGGTEVEATVPIQISA